MTDIEYKALSVAHPELKLPAWHVHWGMHCLGWLERITPEELHKARMVELITNGYLRTVDCHHAWQLSDDDTDFAASIFGARHDPN